MCMCIMCIKMFNIYTIFSDLQIDLIFLNLRLKVLNIYLCNMGRPQKKNAQPVAQPKSVRWALNVKTIILEYTM
jgi:hypothetical protein